MVMVMQCLSNFWIDRRCVGIEGGNVKALLNYLWRSMEEFINKWKKGLKNSLQSNHQTIQHLPNINIIIIN